MQEAEKGREESAQYEQGSTPKEIIGIKNDGTLLIFGDFDGKSDAEKWTDIKEVALQYGSDMVGLKNDGTLITLLKNQTEISSWSNIGY